MRAFKKTNLVCGLMTIPVAVCKATEDSGSVLDRAGPSGAPIIRKEFDSGTDKEIDADQVQYGIRIDESFFPISKVDSEKAKNRTKIDGIQIQDFISIDQLDIKRIQSAYYLRDIGKGGNPKALKAFTMGLLETEAIAVGMWTAISRQYLVALYPTLDGALIMNSLAFAEQWRSPENDCVSHMQAKIPDELVFKVVELISATGNSGIIDTARDEYVHQTRKLLLDALNGTPIEDAQEEETLVTASDKILEALEASIKLKEKA